MGKLVALLPALGPITLVLCRLAQSELAAFTDSHSWSASFTLSSDASNSLLLLVDSFSTFNGAPIRSDATAVPLSRFVPGCSDDRFVHGIQPTAIIASDASAHAVCSYNVQGAQECRQYLWCLRCAPLLSGHFYSQMELMLWTFVYPFLPLGLILSAAVSAQIC